MAQDGGELGAVAEPVHDLQVGSVGAAGHHLDQGFLVPERRPGPLLDLQGLAQLLENGPQASLPSLIGLPGRLLPPVAGFGGRRNGRLESSVGWLRASLGDGAAGCQTGANPWIAPPSLTLPVQLPSMAFPARITRRWVPYARDLATGQFQQGGTTPVKLGSGQLTFEEAEGWARLPEGWDLGEVPGIAVDSRDRVYAFCRARESRGHLRPGRQLPGLLGVRVSFVRPHMIFIGPDDSVYCVDDNGQPGSQVHHGGRAADDPGAPPRAWPTPATMAPTSSPSCVRVPRSTPPPTWPWLPTETCSSPTDTAMPGFTSSAPTANCCSPGETPETDPRSSDSLTASTWIRRERSMWPTARIHASRSSLPRENSWTNGPKCGGPTICARIGSRNFCVAEIGGIFMYGREARLDKPAARMTVRAADGSILAEWCEQDPYGTGRFFLSPFGGGGLPRGHLRRPGHLLLHQAPSPARFQGAAQVREAVEPPPPREIPPLHSARPVSEHRTPEPEPPEVWSFCPAIRDSRCSVHPFRFWKWFYRFATEVVCGMGRGVLMNMGRVGRWRAGAATVENVAPAAFTAGKERYQWVGNTDACWWLPWR